MAARSKSDYFFSLDKASKSQYIGKLSLGDSENPCTPGVGFSEDVSLFPSFR